MRKLTIRLLFIISCLSFTTTDFVSAQALNTNEVDSLGQKYFYQAYDDTVGISNQEKIRCYEQADSLFRIVKKWNFCIASILEASKLIQIERQYAKADRFSKMAIDIAERYLDPYDFYYGQALNMSGISKFEYKKDYKNAIKLFKKTIEIDKKNKTSLLYIVYNYFNISECYIYTGDYDQAIEYSEKALTIQIDSARWNDKMIPKLYNQKGFCYSKKNQPDLAIQSFEAGIKYAVDARPKQREIDQILLYLYQNLADLYLKNNQLEQAKKYITLALEFQEEQDFIKDNYTYQLQGQVFLKEHKHEAALKAFQNSTAFAKAEFKDTERHPDIGMTYFQTANACLAQNEADSSLVFYQLALINNSSGFDTEKRTSNPPVEKLINPLNAIDIFEGKAKAFFKKHKNKNDKRDLEHAFENYALAVESISKTRQSFNAEGSKFTLAEKTIPIYEGAIETAYRLYQITNDIRWLEKAFQFAEGNKAAALLEAIQNNEAMGTTGIPDSLLVREYDLQVEIAFYEQLIHEESQKKSAAAAQKEISEYKNTLFDFKEAYQKLIDGFEANYPEYYALKYKPKNVDLKAIQKRLKNTALIEFFVGQEYIFIFTITDKHIYCEQLVKGENFEKDIQTLRSIIATAPTSKTVMNTLEQFVSVARRQYRSFLKPACTSIPQQTQHLIIVPDDLLAYLPFSLLLDQGDIGDYTSYKNLPYLFNKYGISYNYSAALWLKHLDGKENLAERQFIGFAPEFSAYTGDDQLSPLSCNIKEVSEIGQSFGTEDFKLEAAATLENFKNNAGKYQIVHLATHTTLDHQNSAFNRIYFSDTYLNQNDLYQLDLNAELSVLSACNTGTGELKKGEGVMSLSRGFIHAGCPSILMSLWSVDDCATADIMLAYYKGLEDGKPKEVALQQAKSKYLEHTSDLLQAHPYYWAAFVQYGNTDSMTLGTVSWQTYIWGGGILVLLALLLFFFRKKA